MPKNSKTKPMPQCVQTDVISRFYGFEIGEKIIEVKAKSEKHAMLRIIRHYWELIDKAGGVRLLGEAVRNGL